MEGIQAAIDQFNAMGHPGLEQPLRSAEELFKDWVVAVYLDREDRFDFRSLNFGDPDDSWGYTIDVANDLFWNNRGIYGGANGKFEHSPHVPGQTALPFGTSYEVFRNPGPTFTLSFDGEDSTAIAPHIGTTHWCGGYESQSNNILDVSTAQPLSGAKIDFWTSYFIEERWDYGFVEAARRRDPAGRAFEPVPRTAGPVHGRDLEHADRRPDVPRRGLFLPRHEHRERKEVTTAVPCREEAGPSARPPPP